MSGGDCLILNEPLAAIRSLRRVAELVHDSGDPAAERFVSKLGEYENSVRAGFTFDEIFGLKPHRGGRSWHDAEMLQKRDSWLRLAAQRYFAGPSIAEQIVDALSVFAAGDWQKVKAFADPPSAWRGTEREAFFWVLKAGDDVLAARSVRRILKR